VIVRGRQVRASASQQQVLPLPSGCDPLEPLQRLDDGFYGTALLSTWLPFSGGGTESASVANGELDYTVDAGGVGFAFWFNANQGTLRHKVITGNFDVVARVRVRNLANSGLPTVGDGNFRLFGIAAHDPARGVSLNYMHVALGCTASAGITCEWKDTATSVSTFAAITDANIATGIGEIRLRRVGQIFDFFYRLDYTNPWTLVQTRDRSATPFPDALQVGFMCYASVAGHDERGFVDNITFRAP
jgi:hypothetical protein